MVRRRLREIGEQTLEIRALEFTGLHASGSQIGQLAIVGFQKPLGTIGGLRGCCQTNSNQSLQRQDGHPLCRAELAPLGESGGTVQLEI